MAVIAAKPVLSEALGPAQGRLAMQAALVLGGVAFLTLAAKAQIDMWPSPVPITLGTFAVLTLGAAYGPRLGLVTILAYMVVGAIGFDVFAGSAADNNGIAYMMGGTGGYLAGYVLATLALGFAARAGWDRSILMMALAMLIGNALIYVPGVAWLAYLYLDQASWAQVLEWGLWPYLIGDGLKLAAAALLLPAAWKLVGDARA